MAYDPENNVVVVFGGFDNGQSLGDTWILDCETLTWSQPETQTSDTGTQTTEPNQSQTETTSNGIPGYPALSILVGVVVIVFWKRRCLC